MKAIKANSIVLAITAALVAAVWLAFHLHHHNTIPKATATNVILAKPSWQTLPNVATATATLKAIQYAELSSQVGGYITAIKFNEGDHVNQGDLLIQLKNDKEKNALTAASVDAKQAQLRFHQEQTMYRQKYASYDDYLNAKVIAEKDEATLKTAETNVKDKSISAPFGGTVGSPNYGVGDYIAPGTPLLTITNTQKLRIEYALPVQFLNTIALGQSVTISSPFLSDNEIHGQVTYIAPTVDPNTQTIDVHAIIDNKQHQLKPGLSVNVKQTLGIAKKTMVIPSSSLFASIKGYYVYTVANNKAVKLPVQVGQKLLNTIEIIGGLSPDQYIIVSGQANLQPGNPVHIKKRQIA